MPAARASPYGIRAAGFGRDSHCVQSANSGPSDRASTEDDFFARFPVSSHWIDGTDLSRRIGSSAAIAARQNK